MESVLLVDPKTAAAMLNVSLRTLLRWAYSGRVPSLKLGRKSRKFRLEDIRKVAQSGLLAENSKLQ